MTPEYCSSDCYDARKRILRRSPRDPECGICGERFERTGNRQKFCAGCREKAREEYRQRYAALNREALRHDARVAARAKYASEPERIAEQQRAWRVANKDRLNAVRRTAAYRERAAARLRAKSASSPAYRTHVRMASAIHQALRERKAGRKWEALVGYSLADLMAHLENQFGDGMGWHNMGEWHIDHIVPKCSFEYASPCDPGFTACWALDNLQPMWAAENQAKGAKMPDEWAAAKEVAAQG